MTREILLFLGGVGVLYFGAEWLVRGSARLAASLGVSPIVVGLTVVSMGTSAPELVISVVASLGGNPDLAIGNVMGSNLANVGLVLGISAILRPLRVSAQVVTREVAVMLFITAALLPLIWDHHIGRLEGLLLVTMLVFYLGYVLRTAKTEGTEARENREATRKAIGLFPRTIVRDVAFVVLGVGGPRAGGLRNPRVRRRDCRGAGGLGAGDRSHSGIHRHLASRARHLRGCRPEARGGHRGG